MDSSVKPIENDPTRAYQLADSAALSQRVWLEAADAPKAIPKATPKGSSDATHAAPAAGPPEATKVCQDFVAQTALHHRQLSDSAKKREFVVHWNHECLSDPRAQTDDGLDLMARDILKSLGEKFDRFQNEKQAKTQKSIEQGISIGSGIDTRVVDPSTAHVDDPWWHAAPARGALVVSRVAPNSPASEAGVKPFDTVVSINGIKTNTMGSASQLLDDKPNAPVDLEVRRRQSDGTYVPLKFHFVQREMQQDAAEYKSLGQHVGYISLRNFMDSRVTQQMETALKKASGDSAIVLDLRGNGGGYVERLKDVAQQFIESGDIFDATTGGANPKREKFVLDKESLTHVTDEGSDHKSVSSPRAQQVLLSKGVPVVILTDEFSASAAEMLAGSLRRNLHAVLVGLPTFGKNTIQDVLPVESGHVARITEGEFFPGGQPLPVDGLKPDKPVPWGRDSDTQLVQAKSEALRLIAARHRG